MTLAAVGRTRPRKASGGFPALIRETFSTSRGEMVMLPRCFSAA
jgi:hypothetical protein